MKPSDFALGSIESRAAARVQLKREATVVLRVSVIHIGYDGVIPLPPLQVVKWKGGSTEIVHLAGATQ
jgi:hypothetical protein